MMRGVVTIVAIAALCVAVPAVLADAGPSTQYTAGDLYWWNEVTGETALTDPLVEQKGHTTEDGHTYWIDPATKNSTWEKPEPWAWEEADSEEHEGRNYYHNTVSKAVTWEKPVVLGWQTSEVGFWYNSVTGVNQIDPPEELGHHDPENNRTYWVDPVTKEAVWEAPESYAWTEHDSEEHDDRKYYYNAVTKETLWDKPAALGWSRKSRTKTFWFNQVTGESVRERPAALGIVDEASGQTYYTKPSDDGGMEATWDKPANSHAAWTEHASDEHDGRPFYVNEVTDEKVWEKPKELGWITYHEDL